MHEVIVVPFLGKHLVLSPGREGGLGLPEDRYLALATAPDNQRCPEWLVVAAARQWGLDLAGRPLAPTVLVRPRSPLGYGRASYELNMGCNYACKHCYLGLKEFAGLAWPERERLLHAVRDAGVVWLQLTGGEPMIDRHFADVYALTHDLGMMVEILTNGSQLHRTRILDLLTARPPHRITLSLYGATEQSYDGLTQRPGAWASFVKGLDAVREARLPIDLRVIVTRDNAHELDDMHALAERYGLRWRDYTNMSPTIHGGGETLPSQAVQAQRPRKPFTGCAAGHTSFHVDPHGRASICKIGREPNISLLDEGVEGLARLGHIADGLLERQGGCTGCGLSSTCGTCMPLVALYRAARAPLSSYCQHTEPRVYIPLRTRQERTP
jgi:MoaA/NifB/PqqE/SkfB family radical SAM enzyme